ERTFGISSIRHLERKRTITLEVTPQSTVPLQEAMETISDKIVPIAKQQGILNGLELNLSGSADKLTEAKNALKWNFILAAIITYLLMAALFDNFIYPLIIMLIVPLGGAGGFIGLFLVNKFLINQPFDILTMLGFILLVGVVVNNPILIVDQTLNNIRNNGMNHYEAVMDATRTRIKPIYMSALTSIFGMLPLVLAPGPGSEFYRGLGSVVLGGLALSTVFTIFLTPPILLFFIKMEKIRK
ncbi:MAG: efflux RND transporter permease subunit, partial [Candidatus Magnetoovum sp. WYHC-5]|nr:efflux RND transporter permease subunit [Candidatus Magnetoovum sp. WYHC-5]